MDDVPPPAPPAGRLVPALSAGAAAALLARDLDLPNLVSYWGDRAPLVAATALLFACLWATRLRPALGALLAALAAAWLVAAFSPLARGLAWGLPRRDAPREADAVFVLSSRLQRDGEFTGTALARLVHGLELLGEGRAPRLVLSELGPEHARYAPAARSLMASLGLRQELLTVGPVRNTHDEAVAAAALLRERGWRRLLLVTSPLHSRRAAAAFERQGIEVVSSPAAETRFDLETLETGDERLMALGSVLHERLGIAVYRWRGWLD